MNIKIAIADDHSLIAEGVSNMLRYSSDIEVVATYPNGKLLLSGLEKIVPDILLLDIHMPDKQGDELAPVIKKKYPAVKIIALTSFDNIFYIKSMLQHKIEGYLLKHVSRETLIEAIKTVFNGGTFLEESVRAQIKQDEEITKRQKEMGTALTKREKEILKLIAGSYTSSEIAEMLFLSKRTVDHHRESIMSKLDVKKTSALVKKAAEMGLIG